MPGVVDPNKTEYREEPSSVLWIEDLLRRRDAEVDFGQWVDSLDRYFRSIAVCIQLLSTSAILLCASDQGNYVMECDAKIALYSLTICASSNSWRPQFVGTDGRYVRRAQSIVRVQEMRLAS